MPHLHAIKTLPILYLQVINYSSALDNGSNCRTTVNRRRNLCLRTNADAACSDIGGIPMPPPINNARFLSAAAIGKPFPNTPSISIRTSLAAQARAGQFISVYTQDKSALLPRPISICETDKEKTISLEAALPNSFASCSIGGIPMPPPINNGNCK